MGCDISKQLYELEDYIETSTYIKKVLDNFSSIDKLTSNDIYDIIYAEKIVEDEIRRGVFNNSTKEALEETLDRLKVIIQLISDKDIKEALANKKIDCEQIDTANKTKKINKIKYNKASGFNKLFNISHKNGNEIPIDSNSKKRYIKSIMWKYAAMTTLLVLWISGYLMKIVKFVIHSVTGVTISKYNVQSSAITNMLNISVMITAALALIIVVYNVIITILQFMTITMTFFNDWLITNLPHVASKVIETNISDNREEINTKDRIEIANTLLDNMIFLVENAKTKSSKGIANEVLEDVQALKGRRAMANKELEEGEDIASNNKSSIKKLIYVLVDSEIYYMKKRKVFDALEKIVH